MRLVFAGTPATALPSLETLLASRHDVVAVLTRPDAPSGRGRGMAPSAVKEMARDAGVEVLTPRRPGDAQCLARLTELAPDACPIVAYGALLPEPVLAVPRRGWVNLHFSVLPAWRGAAPVQHAVIAGDDVTGATTFLVEPTLDTGPVLGTLTEPIRPTDTAGDLLQRLATAGAGLLLASLEALESGAAAPVRQPADGVSYAPKVTVADAEVRWTDPAVAVDRRIRGCTPAPGAWSTFRDERINLHPLQPLDAHRSPDPDRLEPGRLAVTKKAVHVGTATVPVQLGLVQPPGRKAMPAADWARGVRVLDGETFGG